MVELAGLDARTTKLPNEVAFGVEELDVLALLVADVDPSLVVAGDGSRPDEAAVVFAETAKLAQILLVDRADGHPHCAKPGVRHVRTVQHVESLARSDGHVERVVKAGAALGEQADGV